MGSKIEQFELKFCSFYHLQNAVFWVILVLEHFEEQKIFGYMCRGDNFESIHMQFV